MQSTPLQLAISVFYFFWATLGASLLILHLDVHFSLKDNRIPRYYLGALIAFTLAPILFALGASYKPILTLANTVYVLGFIELTLAIWQARQTVPKSVFYWLIVLTLIYAIAFEYLREQGAQFFVERVVMTNTPAIIATLISLWGTIALNRQRHSWQLITLMITLCALTVFLSLRVHHLLVHGANGVASIYQEQEQWILWVRIINGALLFLATLTLHNYFFKENWQFSLQTEKENTQIKALLEERETLISSLLKANKTAATGALSASIAHELNQPLGASSINIQFLKRKLAQGMLNPQIGNEVLTALEADNKRAATIVQSLRSIFTEGKFTTEQVDLAQIIQETIELSKIELKAKNIQVQLTLEKELLACANGSEIHQVLINLINNAIHALANCGSLLRHLRIEASKGSDTIRVSISDNGPGVAPQFIPQLFELLSTTKQSGMGLGLWLCKHIITRYNGKIQYEKSKDNGAAFIFELPRAS